MGVNAYTKQFRNNLIENNELKFDENGNGYVEHITTSEIPELIFKPKGLSKQDYLKDVDFDKLKSEHIKDDATVQDLIENKDKPQAVLCEKHGITRGQLDIFMGKLYDQYRNNNIPEGYKAIQGGIYGVNDRGDVINIHHRKSLTQTPNKNGYLQVSVKTPWRKQNVIEVHVLVCKYHVPNPELKDQINHKDGNIYNNNSSNLEWVTHTENIRHAYETGLNSSVGENHPSSKLTKNDVVRIKEMAKLNISNYKIAKLYNVTASTIKKITTGKTWKHAR